MRNRKGIPKVALVSKPPRVVILSYVSNRKLSNISMCTTLMGTLLAFVLLCLLAYVSEG